MVHFASRPDVGINALTSVRDGFASSVVGLDAALLAPARLSFVFASCPGRQNVSCGCLTGFKPFFSEYRIASFLPSIIVPLSLVRASVAETCRPSAVSFTGPICV